MDSIALNYSKRNCCSFAFETVHKLEFLPRGGDPGGNRCKTFTHLSIPDIMMTKMLDDLDFYARGHLSKISPDIPVMFLMKQITEA